MDPSNVAVVFAKAVTRHGQRPATRIRSGDGWTTRSYAELGADVRRLAARLLADGLERGDRVAIFAPNLPEWSLVDLACLSAGLVVVPLYPTSTPEEIRHILGDSRCRLAFIAGESEWVRLQPLMAGLPELRRVVSFTAVGDPAVTTLADEVAAAPPDGGAVDAALARASGDDLATIIYTSGTTGPPKGAMLTHRGFTHQLAVLTAQLSIGPDDSSLSFLPLSHALERAWTFVVLASGCLNTYVPDPRTVAEQLVLARPTMLVSVPRLYEKVVSTAHQKVAGSALKQRLMAWALRVGGQYHSAAEAGAKPSPLLRVQFRVADALVLNSIRNALGGAKSVLACGGAPLRQEIEEFFFACGLPVLQGYGLTEASPLVSFPSPAAHRFGTVGRVIDGSQVRLTDAGEICYRGPNLMLGYWGQPEASAAVLVDGWLHTGDVGEVDADGYLRITDRIKDLIVTSNGKNIAPGPIEGLLATDPLLEHALVLGDNRPYLTLLVAPSLPALEDVGRRLQLTWERRDELLSHPAVLHEIRERVTALTSQLAKHEQIRDLRMAVEEFTQENGLLTPTLKIKRREVERRFAHLIDEMYAKVIKPRGR
ncbi:AMP-dependent synthetase/ligase [Micropruina sonneratiae]|uniref:AMP-dependent synthetase/ligase n=1 Tax=Micropruina sonneratiae TaxID=2986940 RepID=UPI002227BED5|nr:long-chain fatty acid--CoA ligase [Micropruina sp. KQZ13P-5]MCW3157474.1 long-chain fatty acid--CoA ligase [Micropruina sp. KQZ13P-5]